VIDDIARSEWMKQLAQELNFSKESLYSSFSESGNPSFTTVIKLLDLLGYRIAVKQKKRNFYAGLPPFYMRQRSYARKNVAQLQPTLNKPTA
jgi:DNA-binding XRE family transcriptional regulator